MLHPWAKWFESEFAQELQLSVSDIGRLLRLVSGLAEQTQHPPSEVIDRLEAMLNPQPNKQMRDRAILAEFVSRILRVRMRRNEIVGAPLFRDPAWDMLMELFVAHERGRPLSVSSLCYASGVPPTTALRHLARMEAHGLITREGDSKDNRRLFVSPTEKAVEAIAETAILFASHDKFLRTASQSAAGGTSGAPAD